MMKAEELHKLLYDLCLSAYDEGKRHQYDHDFPDVGMYREKTFNDTETFKILEKYKK
jgi:hypothetical protein